MDSQLHTILRLYGEADGTPAPHDPDATALAEARFLMDHRPRVRPDAASLEAIFAAAAPPVHAHPGIRADRGPVARRRMRRAAVLVATTLAVVVGLVFVPLPVEPAVEPPVVAAMEAPAPPVSAPLSESLPEAGEALTPAPAAPAPAQVFAWEADRARLDAVERKTADLRARLDSAMWDIPAADLSLGAAPGPYTQASTRRAQ